MSGTIAFERLEPNGWKPGLGAPAVLYIDRAIVVTGQGPGRDVWRTSDGMPWGSSEPAMARLNADSLSVLRWHRLGSLL